MFWHVKRLQGGPTWPALIGFMVPWNFLEIARRIRRSFLDCGTVDRLVQSQLWGRWTYRHATALGGLESLIGGGRMAHDSDQMHQLSNHGQDRIQAPHKAHLHLRLPSTNHCPPSWRTRIASGLRARVSLQQIGRGSGVNQGCISTRTIRPFH